ncbi:MAG: carbohydrate-binding family 9-like protein [Tannerellaceae bacterium]|jgi:hypothetical protein|nr:carbohydrate-binding family 9-like protein [Tannerellaceae bacterium]
MKTLTIVASLFMASVAAYAQQTPAGNKPAAYEEHAPYAPSTYVCYKLPAPITIDGKISPEEWDAVPWTNDFADMMGDKGPKPYLQTKVKMAHDDEGMYFAVWMEEPHIWATFTRHDAALYQENAFEFFIDPSNNTHNYLEYEINALGTEWDLFLSKPYRDAHMITLSNWEFLGMKSAVYIDGTVNNPQDRDKFWSVEIFIPWRSIYQVSSVRRSKPLEGDQIRVNFQRVEWTLDVREGKYVKIPIPGEERIRSHFWLWSPIEAGTSHAPEYWGYVQFTDKKAGEGTSPFVKNPDEDVRWALRNLYFRQAEYRKATGSYATSISDLKPEEVCTPDQVKALTLHTTPSFYEIILPAGGKTWHIGNDGLVWY